MGDTRPDTWMPLYWGDYAKDTSHLSAAHHGAYLMLIKHYWVTGLPLVDDDDQLWRIACADGPAHWKKLRKVVSAFFKVGGGLWTHARIDKELQLAHMRQQKARKAASRRWASVEHAASIDAPAMPEPSSGDASHNSSPIAHSSVAKATGGKPPARQVIFEEGLPWLVRRSGLDDRSARNVIGRWLRDYGDDAVLAALEQAEAENPVDPVPWITAKFKPREPRETWNQRRIREGLEALSR